MKKTKEKSFNDHNISVDEEYNFKFDYHFNAPRGLINDPNGFSFYNGYYHIFFQWFPDGLHHGLKSWGHIKTKDFITYTKPQIVLKPNKPYDKDGCYSGSAIEIDGILNLFYTGNVMDENNNRSSYQCKALYDKDDNLYKQGVIIESIPSEYTSHFRDPYVFRHIDKYFMVVGAQNKNLQGRIVLYSSLDSKYWIFEGEIKTNLSDFGFMWECPNYFRLSNKDLLMFSPQGLDKEEFKNQNIFQSGYIVGDLDYQNLNFNHGKFKELDKGFDFYAPQVMQEKNGRVIMIAWMGAAGDEQEHPSIKENWVHGLTMPRELTLKDNIIYQKPLEEFKKLRQKGFTIENIEIEDFSDERMNGNSYELILDIERNESKDFEILFALGEHEHTSFKYDFDKDIGILDRNNMTQGPKGLRKFKTKKQEIIRFRMFIDKSAVEIYINDGIEVLTARIYPGENSNKLMIKSNGGKAKIKKLQFWLLKGFIYHD